MNTDTGSQQTADAPEGGVAKATAASRLRGTRFTVSALAAVAAGAAAALVAGPLGGSDVAQARRNTADVVKHEKTTTRARGQGGLIIDYNVYRSGEVNSDGSLVDLGPKIGGTSIGGDSWNYQTPNGTFYSRYGSLPGNVTYVATGRLGKGRAFDSQTKINGASHTYSRTRRVYSVAAGRDTGSNSGSSAPNLTSSPSQVLEALRQGQATQKGMTTVSGRRAIALSVPSPGMDYETWLYVDARTDQPLREVHDVTDSNGFDHGVYVFDWFPATPDNIAQAKNESIPAGYTRVADAF